MNRQSIGVLLCALLASTFGHELLSRIHATHSERVAHSQERSHHQDRYRILPCPTECVTTGIDVDVNLTVVFNATTHIAGIVNISARLVYIKDIKEGLVGIFNRPSNSGILINIYLGIGIFLTNVFTKDELKETEEVFINKLETLTKYWKQGETIYDHYNVTKEIQEFLSQVLIDFSAGGLAVSAKDAGGLLLYISKSISEYFKVVVPLLTSATFSAHTTLQSIFVHLGGLAKSVQQIGGTEILDEKGVQVDTEVIITKSSLEVAVYFLVQLTEKNVDVKKILDSDTNALLWIETLSGNSSACVSGVIKVVVKVVGFINGKVTIDELILTLVDYFVINTGREGSRTKENLDAAISASLSLIKTAGLQTKLKVVIDILVKIKENTLIVANVNVSKIIQTLFRQDLPIRLIIHIFALLKAKIQLEIAVAKLIVNVIGLLVRGGGVAVQVIFGIAYRVTLTISVTVRAFLLAHGNISKALNSISITSQILLIINVSLQAHGTSIESILSTKIVITLILDFVRNLDNPSPRYTHTDVGGAANGNPNNTVGIGSIGGNTVDQHNSGGNSNAHVNGGPNVTIDQTGNKGGSVNHINEDEKEDKDGNKGGITNINHDGGSANGNPNNDAKIGTIGGNQVSQNNSGGNSNVDVGGGPNVTIKQTGNQGGAVNHINETQERGHDKHGYGHGG